MPGCVGGTQGGKQAPYPSLHHRGQAGLSSHQPWEPTSVPQAPSSAGGGTGGDGPTPSLQSGPWPGAWLAQQEHPSLADKMLTLCRPVRPWAQLAGAGPRGEPWGRSEEGGGGAKSKSRSRGLGSDQAPPGFSLSRMSSVQHIIRGSAHGAQWRARGGHCVRRFVRWGVAEGVCVTLFWGFVGLRISPGPGVWCSLKETRFHPFVVQEEVLFCLGLGFLS